MKDFFCAFEVAADAHASGAAAAATRHPVAGEAPPPHHLIINDSPLCDMLLLPHHGIKASNKNSRTGKTSVVLLRLMYDFEVIIYPSYRNSIVVPLVYSLFFYLYFGSTLLFLKYTIYKGLSDTWGSNNGRSFVKKKRLAGLVTCMNYTSFCCVGQTMTVYLRPAILGT